MLPITQKKAAPYQAWFYCTLLYLVIDYVRPQDVLPIGFLFPGMISILILSAFLFLNIKAVPFRIRQIVLIGLFVGLLALYVPFARNNYFAYIATKDMLLFTPFILSAIVCINSFDRLRKIIFFCVVIALYVSGYSLLHHGIGSGNYFHDENDVSLYINMWIPFCYFLFFAEKERSKKIIYLIGMVVGVLSVLASFSRGGFLGLICVAIVCWLFSTKKILSLVVLSLLALLVVNVASDKYWARIDTIQDTGVGTAAIRIESWKAGWKMFLDNPLGVGGNNFPVHFPEYQSDFFKRGMWGRAAHSLLFTLLPELGVLGALIYGLLLRYNIKDIFFLKKISLGGAFETRYIHALAKAFLASLVGFFVSGTFLSVLYYPHYWYLTALIAAATKVAREIKLNSISKPAVEKSVSY